MAQSRSPRISDYWQAPPERKLEILRQEGQPSHGVQRLITAAEEARRAAQRQSAPQEDHG